MTYVTSYDPRNCLGQRGYRDSLLENCVGSSNNLVPRGTKVSAIEMTSKIVFERLYWSQD